MKRPTPMTAGAALAAVSWTNTAAMAVLIASCARRLLKTALAGRAQLAEKPPLKNVFSGFDCRVARRLSKTALAGRATRLKNRCLHY